MASLRALNFTPQSKLKMHESFSHLSVRGPRKFNAGFHLAGKPDSVHNCSIMNQTADSLHVECAEGFNGGLPQTFTMEVFDSVTFSLVSNVTSKSPTFTVSGLEPGINFQIELSSSNEKGKSSKTTLHAHTLAAEKRSTGNTKLLFAELRL